MRREPPRDLVGDEAFRLASRGRQAREARGGPGRELLEDRQHVGAEPIAGHAQVGVRRVLAPADAPIREVAPELVAAHLEQGPQQPALPVDQRDAGETRDVAAPGRAEQQRLRLVVLRVRGGHPAVLPGRSHPLECGVAESSRARLGRVAVALRRVDASAEERDPQCRGAGTREVEIRVRLGTAGPVVHVTAPDALPQVRQRVQQRDGVAASGAGDEDRRRAPQRRRSQKRADRPMHRVHAARVRPSRRGSQATLTSRGPGAEDHGERASNRAGSGVGANAQEKALLDGLDELETTALDTAERVATDVSLIPGFEAFIGAGAILLILLSLLLIGRRLHQGSRPQSEDNEREIQVLIARSEYSKAGDLRMNQGQFDKALALFLNDGNWHKVALCYLALKQPAKAAEMFAKLDRHAEAAHYFQTAGAWRDAAECLRTLGSDREAAELYERAGDLAKAANMMRAMGDASNAARLFERAGLGAEAAAALLDASSREPQALRRAGELFLGAGQVRRAAECFAAAGDWVRAAEIFEDSGEFMLAAQAYERTSEWERAGAAYERSGALPEARTNYERARDHLKAARVAMQMGSLLDAARGFYELGSYERAIETLQQVPLGSPQARDATLLLGRIFLEKGLFDRAREKLEPLRDGKPHTVFDLEVLYYLAEAHERSGDATGAIACLEQLLEVDEAYADAASRLEELQEKAYGESSAPPGYYDTRYELREEIGRGGMGVVYLANDTELGRPVAIKFLPGELAIDPQAVTMFRQEARAAAAMNHPNIVHIYDVGALGGRPCLIMEYVAGKTVREVMRSRGRGPAGALPARRVAEIARNICIALGYAHASGVIHRDVKPGNILISETGEVKLMDFGISKVLEAGRGEGMTQAKGTPQYMPPEQILGREVDGRTDLYALGISMFEMAVGQRPFLGNDVVDQQLHSPLPDPRQQKPELAELFVRLIYKACAKDPADRYVTAHEMANALTSFISSPEATVES